LRSTKEIGGVAGAEVDVDGVDEVDIVDVVVPRERGPW
jgi:hypothetical protein